MMCISQRRIGVILTYISQLVQIITGLLYTSIMLRILGRSEYGLYQLVYSVVSYLGLLSLGFASSYMRFFARFKARDDDDDISKLNGMFMLIFCSIAIICILCGIFMIVNIRSIFGAGLTDSEYVTARILMALMVINLALTFPNSVFNCVITAQENFIFQKTLVLLQYLLNPFLSIPLLIMGFGSIGLVTVTAIITLGGLVVNAYFCFKKLKVKFKFRNLKFSLLKEMWVFTFFIFLNQIIDQINWNIDKILLGRLVGTSAVAIYGVGSQINMLYLQFSTAVSNVFIPRVNTIVAKSNDNIELTKLFVKVGRIQFFIMSLILSGIIFFGQDFIKLWAGEGYTESYYVILFLTIPATVPLIQNLGVEIQRAKNRHKARSIVYLLIAIVNIFISIPFIHVWGSIGAALGTCISLIAGNIIFMNWYYYFKLNIDIVLFWKNILSSFPGLVIPCIVGYFAKRYICFDSIIAISIGILCYCIIYSLSVCFFALNPEEKHMILQSKKVITHRWE